ncbi:hypothetical protein IQ272_20630 [Chroococcidiopsidales cyanobacterium LEGE 13417]|nr:hypothetical protein [Chroococcidiopsidales cyanobacterium LEGE 13417]
MYLSTLPKGDRTPDSTKGRSHSYFTTRRSHFCHDILPSDRIPAVLTGDRVYNFTNRCDRISTSPQGAICFLH